MVEDHEIEDEKSAKGENWGIVGMMNTGKTHTTRELASKMQIKSEGKPILVYDRIGNDSYSDIEDLVTIEELSDGVQLEEYGIFKCQSKDYSLFCEVATEQIRGTIIILDDCGNFFKGNLTQVQQDFITSAKNNLNDHFFQFHNYQRIAPELLLNIQMMVIKEVLSEDIPYKVPQRETIQRLLDEVVAENKKADLNSQWAYRILDMYRGWIFRENKHGVLEKFNGRRYFNN